MKSFLGPSEVDDLEKALGQYVLYHDVLVESDPGRQIYLAVTEQTRDAIFSEPLGQLLLKNQRVRLVVFDPLEEVVVQWIP